MKSKGHDSSCLESDAEDFATMSRFQRGLDTPVVVAYYGTSLSHHVRCYRLPAL
jgi:hypothetical protein